MLAIISLACLLSASAGAEVHTRPEVISSERVEHSWHTSVQVGAGFVAEDPAGLVRPRLGYAGTWGQLTLGAPLWVGFQNVGRAGTGLPTVERARWLTDWSSPQTYAGMLERLHVSFGDRTVEITGGVLRQETLGRGALVDQYVGTYDPTLRRTGLRLDITTDSVRIEAMADDVVNPSMLAAHVELAPLMWLGLDSTGRVRVWGAGAVDPFEETGGGELGASVILWRGTEVAVETYASAVLMHGLAFGGQAGAQLQYAPRDGSGAMTLALEGLLGTDGYQPGYFDALYAVERYAVPTRSWQPKRAIAPRGGPAARGRLDIRAGPVRLGVAALTSFRGELTARAYGKLELDRVSVAAFWTQRNIDEPEDLIHFGASTVATLDASVRLWEGLFAFSTLHHGRRMSGVHSQVVFDWVAGVGYGLGGVL